MKPLGRTGLLACLLTRLLLAQSQPSLERSFREQYAQPQPAWIGYTVPAVPGHERNCDYGNDYSHGVRAPGPVHLEPPEQVQIMLRIQDNHVGKIRAISGECQLDADGVPLPPAVGCDAQTHPDRRARCETPPPRSRPFLPSNPRRSVP